MCRIFSILLSFLIILNSSGYIFIYIERLASNKRTVEMIINSAKDMSVFEKFVFTKKEYYKKFNWKDDNEFELNGNMYDIAKVETKNKQIVIYCIRDDKEEQLISNFEKVHNNNSTKDKIHFPCNQLNTLNFNAIDNDSYSQKRFFNIILFSESFLNNYVSVFLKFPTPPPRFV